MLLTRRERVLLAALLMIGIVAGGYYFAYRPFAERKAELETELATLNGQLAKLTMLKANEKSIDSDIKSLEYRFSQQKQAFTRVAAPPQYVIFLASLEHQTGVDLMSIGPGQEGVSLNLKGGYGNITGFLRGLEELEDVYQCHGLSITSASDGGVLVSLSASFKGQVEPLEIVMAYQNYVEANTFGKENPFR